ncbi:MAG: LPS assembly lipoprotein LptE, partial [Bacteroidaceae bacterium]|nr:LPS assembly lipoprotein LptE [Bacteroidaceae bacterium]
MVWNKKIYYSITLILLSVCVLSCSVSYKLNGASINYDKVKTISIAHFAIKGGNFYAPLATTFNEDLKDIFVRQTHLRMVKRNADLQIEGEITGYNV